VPPVSVPPSVLSPVTKARIGHDLKLLIGTTWALDRQRVVTQMVLLVISGVIGGFGLLLLVPIVNSVAGDSSSLSIPVFGDLGVGSIDLWVLLAGFIVVAVLQAAVARATALNSTRLQHNVVDRLRQEAFEAVLTARWAFVLSLRRSDIIQVVTIGASRSGMAVEQVVRGSVLLVLALVTAAISILVEPVVGSLAVVAVVAVAVVRSTGIRPAHQLGRMFSTRSQQMQAVVTDSLDSLRLVRAHDASDLWARRLADAFAGTREVQIANTQRMSNLSAVTSVGLAVGVSVLVLVSVAAGVEPAAIVVMVILISRLNSQVTSVLTMATQLANSLPAVGDIRALTEQARQAVERPAAAASSTRPSHITEAAGPLVEFRDVSFAYGDTGGGVRNLDLVIPHGRITALTGPSGAGKSTTADLVLGLLEPDVGQVLVAGEALQRQDLSWWRQHVAYVPQETLLLPGTLRDNLVWSVNRVVTDAECARALRQAAAVFVDGLPDGLDTVLGERGVRLSGGERQRVAIARALLRHPTLLVLDEATSSLDDETEMAVLDTIAGLTPAVTVLVVAHRRTTLDLADHVIRIEQGRRA
jgi:ABC-type multidrug transport system fused ATPase/permease subunit